MLLVVWLSQDYFSITLPSTNHQDTKKQKLSAVKPEQKEKQHLHSIKKSTKERVDGSDTVFSSPKNINPMITLLNQNKFYDALSYYLEHSTEKNQAILESYLEKYAANHAIKALEYMQVYLDEVPQSRYIKKLMIATYISQSDFEKGIHLIMDAKENYISEAEDTRLTKQLKSTAVGYIDTLVEKKEYTRLITFLEEMIAYDEQESFYQFRLAQLYLELDKSTQASALLDTLQYDEVYAQKAKSYIQTLEIEEASDVYKYAIPLRKYGSHYVVEVLLNGNPFSLMLDTGASYIYIDKDKASMLDIVNPNLRLQTAGGDVHAELRNASSLRIGDLELQDIKVTTAPFKREGMDGLLGMNFLNRFAFFINQEENILYLNNK